MAKSVEAWQKILKKVDDYRWEIPQTYKEGMRVPGLIYASQHMLEQIWEEQAAQQVVSVAFLPGIQNYSLAMPDIHWGYGFPIGGVAATSVKDGVISPGGVGFDINCGVRLIRTNLEEEEVKPRIERLVTELYNAVPSGLGSSGRVKVTEKELERVLVKGGQWAVERGMGEADDIPVTEEQGTYKGADPDTVSDRAKKRGLPQLGTLGSGNHFLEVGVVSEIYQPEVAEVMGLTHKGQVVFWVHTGSRGFGHEVCTDYVKSHGEAIKKYGISLPDRQLACAPVSSKEGKDYLAAMACAANYAWTNRQCITHWVRETFCQVLDKSEADAGLELVYDVAHNIAKIEEHLVDGRKMKLCVHRKGATRAFPAGHPDVPARYSKIGQPVFIPGDMGRFSYVLVGAEGAMKETFGSTCHGAGRVKSRAAAKRMLRGSEVVKALEAKGITVRAGSMSGLAEEASEAYKDVTAVVEVAHKAGISKIVARTRPLGVIKG